MSGANFDRASAERIIRRAIELDDSVAPGAADHMTEEALREAAEEIGIDIAAVRQAAAEERLGLTPSAPKLRDRIVGADRIVAAYPFDCSPAEALERIDAWMRKASGFRRIQVKPNGAEYRRRSDAVAALQRASRKVTGREHLAASIERISVLIEPLHDGTSLVAFIVDKSVAQNLTLATAGTVAGGGSIAAAALAIPLSDLIVLGVPGAIAAGIGIGAARKLALKETEISLTGVVRSIATEPSLGEMSGSAASNAVKGLANLVNKGVTAAGTAASTTAAKRRGTTPPKQSAQAWRNRTAPQTAGASAAPAPPPPPPEPTAYEAAVREVEALDATTIDPAPYQARGEADSTRPTTNAPVANPSGVTRPGGTTAGGGTTSTR